MMGIDRINLSAAQLNIIKKKIWGAVKYQISVRNAYNSKSREILPAHNLFFTQPIVLKLDTENSNITAMLLANLGKIG